MLDEKKVTKIRKERERWEQTMLPKWMSQSGERKKEFQNTSNMHIKRLYTPEDTGEMDYLKELGFPGEFPFIRGVHATMYRSRLWTMRQFSGFGTARQTNQRFEYLLKEGETGLSMKLLHDSISSEQGQAGRGLSEFRGLIFIGGSSTRTMGETLLFGNRQEA